METTQCNQPNGVFTIHEAHLAPPDGSIDGIPLANLALDFSVSCAGSPPISGAVRISSVLPLPL